MELQPYVDSIQRQLIAFAETGGDDARALAARLVGPLDATVRLALQDVLALAAEEITCELAPGSVELRLRGRDPEFVVMTPPAGPASGAVAGSGDFADEPESPGWPAAAMTPPDVAGPDVAGPDEGGMSRINLRMPDHLKARIETAASRERLSVNSWLVRAATAVLDRTGPDRDVRDGRDPGRGRRAPQGAQRYTGWVR